MSTNKVQLPEIAEAELSPLVQSLVQLIRQQQAHIERLEEELKRLKDQPPKPKLKPSKMDQETEPKAQDKEDESGDGRKKKHKPKRSKTAKLKIHETRKIAVEEVPAGAEFKGYVDYVVQDLVIKPCNTRYLLAQWQLADGSYLTAKVPSSEAQGHYGTTLISYMVDQYYRQHVTQPLLLEHLQDIGIEISAGQLSRLLTEDKEGFHEEKAGLLKAGIEVSNYLHTDDTGARHAGQNGYCTYIGNELFAWFKSTETKSRVNFLELLRAEQTDYVLNAAALEYMARQRLPQAKLKRLEEDRRFADSKAWEHYLSECGLSAKRHRQIATEGALMGSLLAHGFPVDMSIVSDDAGQFNVFSHALCWIHAERGINKLIALNERQHKMQEWVRSQIWDLYADLKVYKQAPNEVLKEEISARFDELCATRTDCATLNQTLKRLHHNKAELLLVLDKPWLPLHNNLSERDIRDYVKKNKISAGTRSEQGRRCRDTFTSLKKTCKKHGISFWQYVKDRVAKANEIMPLPDVIRQAAQFP